MSRQELIEEICSVINRKSSDKIKSEAKELLNKVISNSIDENEALLQLNELTNTRYWKSVDLPKSLYDNLKKWVKGELSDTQELKMVSSIVTRCLIESEFHDELDIGSTGIYEFLDYLNCRIYNRGVEINLLDLLSKYGFIESKEE